MRNRLVWAFMVFLAPLCHAADVTTTPDAPPSFRYLSTFPPNKDRDFAYSPESAAKQKREAPDLAPLVVELAPDEVFKRAGQIALNTPFWEVALRDPRKRVLEAVIVNKRKKPLEDIVVWVREEGSGSSIHVRSKTRKDGGKVAEQSERIKAFLSELKTACAPVP